MKKIICGFLAFVLIFAFAACSAEHSETKPTEPFQKEFLILKAPPELTVTCADIHYTVKSGNYSWTSLGSNGETGSVIACGTHPLDSSRTREFSSVSGKRITLSFPVDPDEITVIRWPESDVGNIDCTGETVELDGLSFPMEKGGWVYQVIASWNGETWSGQAEYHLYLTK